MRAFDGTYVTTPGRWDSDRISWSYLASPKILSTSSTPIEGLYIDESALDVENSTAFPRQILPSSRSRDLTPA